VPDNDLIDVGEGEARRRDVEREELLLSADEEAGLKTAGRKESIAPHD
jgi:hypothetical protein